MRTFKDAKRRLWNLHITINEMRRVRDNTGIDVARLFETVDEMPMKAYQALSNDFAKVIDVLHAVCLPQCEAKNMTPEDFAAAFNGDVLARAFDAFTDALVDFFPTAKRELLRVVIDEARAVNAGGEAKVLNAIKAAQGGGFLRRLLGLVGFGRVKAAV